MPPSQSKQFEKHYDHHLKTLKLQGKSARTINAYARSVRRLKSHFGCCPDELTQDQLQEYFANLIESHSWSTVKIDRSALKHFWKFVLKKEWHWIDIVKPPNIKTIPDILTQTEVERLIRSTRSSGDTLLNYCQIKQLAHSI